MQVLCDKSDKVGMSSTYLLNWNPNRTEWLGQQSISQRSRQGEIVTLRWSTGVSKSIVSGDRVFLIKQAVLPKGIVASGVVKTHVFQAENWKDSTKQANYVMIDFDTVLDKESVLPRAELPEGVHWDTQGGGITIPAAAASMLEARWQEWLDRIRFRSQAESNSAAEFFTAEGKTQYEIHRRRERDSSIVQAKKIAAWNTLQKLACEVCDFDFATRYGQHGENFIECHHRTPLRDADSEKGQTTRLKDLALVCANCHRMLHRGSWPSVAELRSLMNGS